MRRLPLTLKSPVLINSCVPSNSINRADTQLDLRVLLDWVFGEGRRVTLSTHLPARPERLCQSANHWQRQYSVTPGNTTIQEFLQNFWC
jgi:hypothetical protein